MEYEVVVEVDWQHLGVLNLLVGVLGQVLVVDVVCSLFSFPVGVLGLRRVTVLRLVSLFVQGRVVLRLSAWRGLHSCDKCLLLDLLLLLNLLLCHLLLHHLLLLLHLMVVLLKLLSFESLVLLQKEQLLLLGWIQRREVLLLLQQV